MLCNLPSIANQLTLDFLNLFQFSSGTDGRVRTVTRPELSLPRRSEAAFAIVWKGAGTGGKYCSFNFGKVPWRTEKDELVAYDT